MCGGYEKVPFMRTWAVEEEKFLQKLYHMAIDATLEVIKGKWKVRILCHLGNGTLRTGELRRLMPEVSQKMMTSQLRELEEAGIVERYVYNEMPPRVEYSLTERGNGLRNILLQMSDWGARLIEDRQRGGEVVEILYDNDDGFRSGDTGAGSHG